MGVLEADESYIHSTILPKATHTFKASNNNKSIRLFVHRPTIIRNSFDMLEVTDNDECMYFWEVAQVEEPVDRWNRTERTVETQTKKSNSSFLNFKKTIKDKSNEVKSKIEELDK